MPWMPQAAIAENQTIITGPNRRPTAAVPIRWTRTADDDHRGDRHDGCCSDGCTTLSPSTAESTEIAGVIMLSPKNSDAPNIPSAASTSFVRAPAAPAAPDQRDQREDPALAVVVGAHHQQHVQQRDDDRHRPEDQRDDPVDALAWTRRSGAGRPG